MRASKVSFARACAVQTSAISWTQCVSLQKLWLRGARSLCGGVLVDAEIAYSGGCLGACHQNLTSVFTPYVRTSRLQRLLKHRQHGARVFVL